MKIVTKLHLTVLLPLLLAAAIAGILVSANRRLEAAVEREHLADAIVRGAFELNLLTHEFLRHHGERIQQQWQSRHASLGSVLADVRYDLAADHSLVEQARHVHGMIGRIFVSLVAVVEQPALSEARAAAYEELEQRRLAQLVAESQTLVSLASRLSESSYAAHREAIRWVSTMVLGAVLITTVILAVWATLVSRSIRRPIQRLRAGTETVARGDLQYQIADGTEDELGELARAFDRMTNTLRQTTVSRDDLLREVAQRQQVEAELARSNRELELFAYIASHDLQEPLRAVTGFVELLQRRYAAAFDDKGREYVRFVTEGAARMLALINGLLAYSRVGTRGKPFQAVAGEQLWANTLADLRMSIEESRAEISRDPLPVVTGDPTQLGQVFQNLVGNALKFRGPRAPVIHLGAQRREGFWEFTVRDNGIGIEPEYFERIFVIFQRLHGRQEYPGTGLGLAICKKIVERHGGKIWVESVPGQGSTFHFTIPDQRTEVP